MKTENKYVVYAFFPNEQKPKRWTADKLNSFAMFLNKSHSTWMYFNVYDKISKQYLKRFKNGDFIPPIINNNH